MTLEKFPGADAWYVFEPYERYRQNPDSVDPATRKAEAWTPAGAKAPGAPTATPVVNVEKVGAECIRLMLES